MNYIVPIVAIILVNLIIWFLKNLRFVDFKKKLQSFGVNEIPKNGTGVISVLRGKTVYFGYVKNYRVVTSPHYLQISQYDQELIYLVQGGFYGMKTTQLMA